MGIEALWSVQFISNLEIYGGGVIVFETGRIFGGDGYYYYVGDYATDGDNINLKGKIEVTHYNGPMSSVFGELKKFSVEFTGPVNENKMDLQGELVQDSNLKISAKLVRQAELPG